MKKLMLTQEKMNKALMALESLYQEPPRKDRSNIDATIQRFEFTFELFWKWLKEFFYQEGVPTHTPREVLKEAFLQGFIKNESLWLNMLQDRNLTVHTYDDALADKVFERIKTYVPALRTAFEYISSIIGGSNA